MKRCKGCGRPVRTPHVDTCPVVKPETRAGNTESVPDTAHVYRSRSTLLSIASRYGEEL